MWPLAAQHNLVGRRLNTQDLTHMQDLLCCVCHTIKKLHTKNICDFSEIWQ